MRKQTDSTTAANAAPAEVPGALVSIFVPDSHPLLQLKRALDWKAITSVMVAYWRSSGKNVDGSRGQLWPVQLYVPLLVLMWVESLHSRQMEKYISESVVARRFLDLTSQPSMWVRDHSNISRAELALRAEGKAEVNALIIKTAQEIGFTDGAILSSDTTVQEPAIGYPNEASILKGWVERIDRSMKKLKKGGMKIAAEAIEKAREIYKSVKAYHLFSKGKEEKKKSLEKIVQQSEELAHKVREVISQVRQRCGEVKKKAAKRLKSMVEVAAILLPQIKEWMRTGKAEVEKIIHTGITKARAIVKRKGMVKFGLKWLINRLRGGYLFGKRVEARADENLMPEEGLKLYREMMGKEATPRLVVYDRGASLGVAGPRLKKEGVKRVGIPPRGQGGWEVGEKEQKVVKSERGKTEGSIGRLKSRKYGFSHRQERSTEGQERAGQRAIISANLNTLKRDLTARAKAVRMA